MEFTVITGEKNISTTKRIYSYAQRKTKTGFLTSITDNKRSLDVVKIRYFKKDLKITDGRYTTIVYEVNDNIPVEIFLYFVISEFGKPRSKTEVPIIVSSQENEIRISDMYEVGIFTGKGKINLKEIPNQIRCTYKIPGLNKTGKVLIW